MTEIEALLSVDAGHTPPGATAFFLDDGSRGFRGARAALAGVGGVAAATWGITGGGSLGGVTLALLASGMVALSALPTLREDDNRDPKRQVLVITAFGLIVRDGWGLRSWRFEDIAGVIAGMHESRPYLHLMDKAGKRHIIECAACRRGMRARDLISSRLSLPGTSLD